TLRIAQDTTLDGSLDTVFNAPAPISGICANGVISCRPGTWSSCDAYAWSASGTRIDWTRTDLDQLGGCYCVNNSCGSSLVMANLSKILADIAGGTAGALANSDPYYVLSDTEIRGPILNVLGQKLG